MCSSFNPLFIEARHNERGLHCTLIRFQSSFHWGLGKRGSGKTAWAILSILFSLRPYRRGWICERRTTLSILFSLRHKKWCGMAEDKSKSFNPLFIEAICAFLRPWSEVEAFNPLFIEASVGEAIELRNFTGFQSSFHWGSIPTATRYIRRWSFQSSFHWGIYIFVACYLKNVTFNPLFIEAKARLKSLSKRE